ncbi:hypothetical protein LSPH24S_08836 [Lysinibacillus sphaericus]
MCLRELASNLDTEDNTLSKFLLRIAFVVAFLPYFFIAYEIPYLATAAIMTTGKEEDWASSVRYHKFRHQFDRQKLLRTPVLHLYERLLHIHGRFFLHLLPLYHAIKWIR